MGVERGTRKNNVWIKAEDKGQAGGLRMLGDIEKEGIETSLQLLQHAVSKFGNRPCLGTRDILERVYVSEDGKKMEKLVLGEYHWKSYHEVNETILRFACSLQKLGYKSKQRLAIFGETREEWFISCLGCLYQNLTVVTLYTNLSDAGLIHGLNETEVDTVITTHDTLSRLLKILPGCSCIKTIIVIEDQISGVGDITEVPDGVRVMSYSALLKEGSGLVTEGPCATAEDVAIIMYTSGSTGNPKGVELTHKNIMSAVIAYCFQANVSPGDCYIAYLPLAHIMELLTEISVISVGVKVAYSSPFTLTNNSSKIFEGTKGDARMAQPTVMNAVPLILDRIIKAVAQNVEKQGKVKSKIFREAVKYKQREGSFKFAHHILDVIIFNKVKAELGGNLKMLVVGGAHLTPETQSLIRTMFGCVVHVGYGCTETCANVSATDADDVRLGHAGPPTYGTVVQLEDWEEGEYLMKDLPRPRGEIIVGGPNVANGYFKLPEETKEAFFDRDGMRWFRTGDIGEFDETGVLYIIDRKNDLVKLKHGEYVSLAHIESVLKTHRIVENICAYADPTESNTIALVIPQEERVRKIAAEAGVHKDIILEELCLDDKVVAVVLRELQSHGKKNGLGRWDIPAAVYLTTHPWTPDNGLVTAAMKLRRKPLFRHYEPQINSMYRKLWRSQSAVI